MEIGAPARPRMIHPRPTTHLLLPLPANPNCVSTSLLLPHGPNQASNQQRGDRNVRQIPLRSSDETKRRSRPEQVSLVGAFSLTTRAGRELRATDLQSSRGEHHARLPSLAGRTAWSGAKGALARRASLRFRRDSRRVKASDGTPPGQRVARRMRRGSDDLASAFTLASPTRARPVARERRLRGARLARAAGCAAAPSRAGVGPSDDPRSDVARRSSTAAARGVGSKGRTTQRSPPGRAESPALEVSARSVLAHASAAVPMLDNGGSPTRLASTPQLIK